MAEFDFAMVRQLVKNRNVGRKEEQKIWWEKFVEFLDQEKVTAVQRSLLEQIDKECFGFKRYICDKYTRPETLTDVEQKMAEVRRKQDVLQKSNKYVIRYSNEWIYAIDDFGNGENTGILFCMLNCEDTDDEKFKHVKRLTQACITYDTFGFRYRVTKNQFDELKYFFPEYIAHLQEKRVAEYATYCEKMKCLEDELACLEEEWQLRRKKIGWLILPNKRYVKVVE